MNRRNFSKKGLIGFSGLISTSVEAKHTISQTDDRIDLEVVKEFVIAGHNDLDKVKAMLNRESNLLFARHDWGGGDFEEAIEGAGHVGNKAIANFLIQKGARVNLFVLTMLGKKELVISALQAYPSLVNARGPHGFSLLHHAKIGGDESKEIYDYLINEGLSETKLSNE